MNSDEDEAQSQADLTEVSAELEIELEDYDPECVRLSKQIQRVFGDVSRFPELSKKPTILYVEDDAFFAVDYEFYLKIAGFSVYTVHTPEEGYQLAESYRHFVAVVLDIKMYSTILYTTDKTWSGQRTGLFLGEDLAIQLPDSIFFALTNSTDAHVEAWFGCET
jgi:CheY-like chemotaxis protein